MQRTTHGEFTWIDLMASDLEKQTGFYESLFGWQHVDSPGTTNEGTVPSYRTFTKDGAMVAGLSPMSAALASAGVPSTWNTYVATPDLDATAARAVELGGTIVMPAMDVMDQGRMAGISDPTGGTTFFWQGRKHHGAESFFQLGALAWNEFETRDPEKAVDYFSKLFGWKIERAPSESPYWTIEVNGQVQAGIMNMPTPVPAAVPPFWFVYFGVADVNASIEKAKSLGATIVAGKMDMGGMSFAVLEDPAGAMFGIMTLMLPK